MSWRKRIAVLVGVLILVTLTTFVLHLVLPRNFQVSDTTITLKLAGGPLDCRYFPPTATARGVVVLGTGDGGWSYWEERTAHSLADHGYFVIGWDCRAFANSRTYDQNQLADGFSAAVEAAHYQAGNDDLPVWYGGWSTGAEQSVAAAAAHHPAELRGLLLAAPGKRGRYGINTSDLLGREPNGPDTFALADLALNLHGLRVAQFVAGLDPMDDVTWLTSLSVPVKTFDLPTALHDMGGAGDHFQALLLDAIAWTLSANPPAR